jgi:glycosyltransferase involved in cell wall biosynthesis
MSGLTRVLITSDAAAAAWPYSLELARGLGGAGVAPVLAVLGPAPAPAQIAEANAVPGLQVIATGLESEHATGDPGALRDIGAALAGLARRVRADTVHLHTPALAAEVAWPVPVVVMVHGDIGTWWQATHGGTLPQALAWRAEAVARGLAEADAVAAPSRSYARALTRLYRPGRAIEVVPLGRSYLPPPPCPRRAAVLACGRLGDPGDNLTVLDRAATLLDVPVLMAGTRAGPDDAAASPASLTLLGQLDAPALALRMAEASVFAAPARYAPFGPAVLEAAQAGMALALADIPTFRELWDEAALYFHPDDAGALADVCRRLLARPQAAAARARQHAERYSAARMVAATLALHRPLAERRAA